MTEIIWGDDGSTFDLGPGYTPPQTRHEIDDIIWKPAESPLPEIGSVTEEEIIQALIKSFTPPPLEFPDQLL